MKKVNVNVIANGELFFTDSDGARLRGNSLWDLRARITSYRERRGVPVGNVDEEMHAQLAARNPGLVRAGVRERPRAHDIPKEGLSFKGRVLTWLSGIRGRKESLSYASDTERNFRVNTCAGCPFNKAVGAGCASCKEVLAESRKEIIGHKAVDARTNGCEILGEYLPVSTWINEPPADNSAVLPAHCWRKKSI
jgi:hypothetical protein